MTGAGTAGGWAAATDGNHTWYVSHGGSTCTWGDGGKGFIVRNDRANWGSDSGSWVQNCSCTHGYVQDMAVHRDKTTGITYLISLEGHSSHTAIVFRDAYKPEATVLANISISSASAIHACPYSDSLYVLESNGAVASLALDNGVPSATQLKTLFAAASIGGTAPSGGITVDKDLNVWLVYRASNKVVGFSPAGKQIGEIGKLATQVSGQYDRESLMDPLRVRQWTDETNRTRILILETGGANRVAEFNTDGSFIRHWIPTQGNADGGWFPDPDDPSVFYVMGNTYSYTCWGLTHADVNRDRSLVAYRRNATDGTFDIEQVYPGVFEGYYPM